MKSLEKLQSFNPAPLSLLINIWHFAAYGSLAYD